MEKSRIQRAVRHISPRPQARQSSQWALKSSKRRQKTRQDGQYGLYIHEFLMAVSFMMLSSKAVPALVLCTWRAPNVRICSLFVLR